MPHARIAARQEPRPPLKNLLQIQKPGDPAGKPNLKDLKRSILTPTLKGKVGIKHKFVLFVVLSFSCVSCLSWSLFYE